MQSLFPKRFNPFNSLNFDRTFASTSTSSARRTRAPRPPDQILSDPPQVALPPRAPRNWRYPHYRPVPHLSVFPSDSTTTSTKTETRDPTSSRPSTTKSYSHLFQTRTRWIARALSRGRHIPSDLLYKLLRHRRVSPEALASWVEVLHKKDPIFALERLGLLESARHPQAIELSSTPVTVPSFSEKVGTGASRSSTTNPEEGPKEEASYSYRVDECPDWLYLSIPAMVTSQHEAPYLVSQLLSDHYSRRLPERSRSIFLSRCIQHFLKVKHYVALREVIEYIAYTGMDDAQDVKSSGEGVGRSDGAIWREESFGRILEALASERQRTDKITSAPRELLHSLRDLVLATMEERSVPRKSLATWLPLFSPALIPQDPYTVTEVLVEMTRQTGLQPRRRILHQALKVLVRHAGMESAEAAQQIKEELSRAKAGVGPTQWHRSALFRRRPDAIPLHLREEKGLAVESEKADINEDAEEESQSLREKTHVAPFEVLDPPATVGPPRSIGTQETRGISSALTSPLPAALNSASISTRPHVHARTVQAPPRPSRLRNDIYSTTQLFERSTSLAYFAELRHWVTSSGRASQFPPPPFPSSRVAWTALFQSVLHDYSVGPKLLIAVLDKLERASSTLQATTTLNVHHYIPPSPSLRLYTVVMRCLLARNVPGHVVSLFDKLRSRGYAIDATLLDLQVRALCLLDREKEAYRLLRYYEHLPSVHDPLSLVSLRTPPTGCNMRRPHSIRLDIVVFNTLLSHYNLVGDYRRVYALFKDLETKHEVRPDIATMTILLDAARYASVAAGRGWGGYGTDSVFGQSYLGGKRTLKGSGLDRKTRRRVDVGTVDDKWDRVPAAKRIELLVWDQLFEMNWQGVEVENPLETKSGVGRWIQDHFSTSTSAVRRRSSSASKSKVKSKLTSSAANKSFLSFVERIDRPPNWQPFVSTLSPRPPLRPDLHPTDAFFRSLILLTGVHSHVTLIGQILAWARYTNVELSRSTLCLALLYVEGDAGVKRHQVDELRTWLSDWFGGPDHVPNEDEIAWMRRGGTIQGKPLTG